MLSKLLMVLCVVAFPLQAFAKAEVGNVEEKAEVSVEVGNTICPVSGEKVGSMGDVVKYEHNGKIYSLCCPGCIATFKKEPEKYSKIAEDEVAAASVGTGL